MCVYNGDVNGGRGFQIVQTLRVNGNSSCAAVG